MAEGSTKEKLPDNEKTKKSTDGSTPPEKENGEEDTESENSETFQIGCTGSKNETRHGRRRFRTLTFGRRYKSKTGKSGESTSKKRKNPWTFKFNCSLKKNSSNDLPEPAYGRNSCVCTGYRKTVENQFCSSLASDEPVSDKEGISRCQGRDYTRCLLNESVSTLQNQAPVIDLSRFRPEDYPIDDWDERARVVRAREIQEGVEPPAGFQLVNSAPSSAPEELPPDASLATLTLAMRDRLTVSGMQSYPLFDHFDDRNPFNNFVKVSDIPYLSRVVHTQIDYIHCLVPDLQEITSCSFYWGKMDRYEAEKLLEKKTEGTFLLRDSAQEEYLFSVSFRRYGRSLHARIEQWNHKFSFDSHDPGVFAADTVCGLIEHYKDPSCCMFFEPMLTIPLHRNFPFPLQHMCRAVICKNATYDGINSLRLPRSLKAYLKEYHYKQRVRVRQLEVEH